MEVESRKLQYSTPQYFRDDTFPLGHRGVRYNLNDDVIDVTDCMEFVCSSNDAARKMKQRMFSKEPTWDVVWSDLLVRRRRIVCTIKSILKVLKASKNERAALLAGKISNLTAIVVSQAEIEEVEVQRVPIRVNPKRELPASAISIDDAAIATAGTAFCPSSVFEGMKQLHEAAQTNEFFKSQFDRALMMQRIHDASFVQESEDACAKRKREADVADAERAHRMIELKHKEQEMQLDRQHKEQERQLDRQHKEQERQAEKRDMLLRDYKQLAELGLKDQADLVMSQFMSEYTSV